MRDRNRLVVSRSYSAGIVREAYTGEIIPGVGEAARERLKEMGYRAFL